MSSTTTKSKDYFKFQLKHDSEKYQICHPSPVTRGADLLLELENFFDKNWLIPVDKEFLVSNIPYFEGLFNTDGFWRETKNADTIEGVPKIKFVRPGEVKKETIVKLLEMLHAHEIYDESDSKCQTINFITKENVLEFIELSEFLMVEHIKKEAVEFVGDNMNGEMMVRALKYENRIVRTAIEPICRKFCKLTEGLTEVWGVQRLHLDDIRSKGHTSIVEAVNNITWAQNTYKNTTRHNQINKNIEKHLHVALNIMDQLDDLLGQLCVYFPSLKD